MNIQQSLYAIGQAAKKRAAKSKGGKKSELWALAQALNGAIHGLAAQFGGVFAGMAKALDIYTHLDRSVGDAIADKLRKVVIYLIRGRLAAMQRLIKWVYVTLSATIAKNYQMALRHIQRYYWLARAYARSEALIVLKDALAAVRSAEAKAKREIRAMHRHIEQEAVSGYRTGYQDRTSEIAKVADFLVNMNPIVRRLVGDLVTGVLDLATIEDPLVRLVLGAIMQHIIDHLSIDKAVGHYLDELLAPILGQPKPHDLHGVVMDISKRLSAMEGQWSQFWTNGGSQVEQAGREWQDLISPVFDVAALAWIGQAYLDPKAWARELSGTVGAAANNVASEITRLVKEI